MAVNNFRPSLSSIPISHPLARATLTFMEAAELAAWRHAYLRRPLARELCAEMAEKYAALAALTALPTGPAQDAALRECARRWPGCLREAQLAGPERCAGRRACAEAGVLAPPRAREAWLQDEDAAAVPLWADLHRLLADQLRWRRARGPRGEDEDVASFVASLAGLDEEAAGRWPSAQQLTLVAGPRVRPRQAYRWLAAQAGLPLASLNYALFARRGPWDARPGDPPVSA